MRIDSLYRQGRVVASCEIFPPKGDMSADEAVRHGSQLAHLSPDYVSVTYAAGGRGNSQATLEIAGRFERDLGICPMAHLTCAGLLAESEGTESGGALGIDSPRLDAVVCELGSLGIENVLALRGDVPATADPQRAARFRSSVFASDLIAPLAERGLCVGAAAYPEGHIDCLDDARNIEHLKIKRDAGAAFFITQLFFDNEAFYRFRERCERAGIDAPMSCGIMPFMSREQLSRMIFMCGVSLPAPIVKLLARYEHDTVALRQAGIEYACRQVDDLVRHGAEGIHVYAMNKEEVIERAFDTIRSALR